MLNKTKQMFLIPLFLSFFLLAFYVCLFAENTKEFIVLLKPQLKGNMSLEEAISQRRSVREFTNTPLTQEQISQLLWAAQGITQPDYGFRAVPSAGAIYPLEIYIVTAQGLMRYLPQVNKLEILNKQDLRKELTAQQATADAAMDMIICSDYSKVEQKYKDKGRSFSFLEAGHVGQNVQLSAVSMGLGSLSVGGFDPANIKKVLNLKENIEPVYIIAVGNAAK